MKRLLLSILATIFTLALPFSATAQYYARGVARCILDDGSGNFPISDAGEVFVGTSADEAPQWTAGEYTSRTISGPLSGSASVTFHFWARAKAGYTFVGWGSTKTSKTATSGTADLEGQPWASKTTFWSAKTEAAPNELVRYAIFRKNATEDLTGGGVAMKQIEGATHVMGSTMNDWPVRVIFAEPLAYRDNTGYTEGYGVNTSLIASITCTNRATNAKTTIMTARVSGSIDGKGTDAYGLVYFPANLAAGTYDVHLPKGLFTTQSGTVTAATDFTLTVTPDDTPFTLVSVTPENNSKWNANSDPEDDTSDGSIIVISLTFNKYIASCAKTNAAITLVNTTYNSNYQYNAVSISMINRKVGIIDYGMLPDGKYTLTVPADVFVDNNGQGNEPLTLKFSVMNSPATAWSLPEYTQITPSIANNSTVTSLTQLVFTMARPDYAAPIALTDNVEPSAVTITEVYKPGTDYSDPDSRPEMMTEPISSVTLAVEDGRLVVNFAEPIYSETKVLVSIPSGAVINVPDASSLTQEELFKAGGCTNPAIQHYVIVRPVVTGIETLEIEETLPSETFNAADTAIYSITGQRSSSLTPGVNIIRTANGTRKVIK